MKVLALDAGKKHFAYAVFELDAISATEPQLVTAGKLQYPIDDMRADVLQAKCASFSMEVSDLVLNGVTAVVFERAMQQPGRTSGSAIEYMNVMLGMILEKATNIGCSITPVAASTWKPMLKRLSPEYTTSSSQLYGLEVSKTRKYEPISDHEFDAISIGVWYAMSFVSVEERASVISYVTHSVNELKARRAELLSTQQAAKPSKKSKRGQL